ncbi:hypothetical protein ACE6H2_023634 [Prunus campanulata]
MMKLRTQFLKTPFDSPWCHLFSSRNWSEQVRSLTEPILHNFLFAISLVNSYH